ncbi:MAG: hypothetical protein ACI85K_002052, partial [Hyphomicrobiaceae bacterium]
MLLAMRAILSLLAAISATACAGIYQPTFADLEWHA